MDKIPLIYKRIDFSSLFCLGSGRIGNLVRLFETSSSNYLTFKYRVRFCWWDVEELGLLGTRYHVDQASLSSTTNIGECSNIKNMKSWIS